MRKLLFIFLSCLFLYSCAGPNGSLEGYIRDSSTTEGIGSADIEAYEGPIHRASVNSTDAPALPIHGYYNMSLPLGDYEIRVSHNAYANSTGNNITISSSTSSEELNVLLSTSVCHDLDNDGFGIPGAPSCPQGPIDDCNDSNANIYPGGPELRVSGATDTYHALTALQSVYIGAPSGKIVRSKSGTFAGNMQINQDKLITLEGGYDCNFSNVTGSTTVEGNLTISDGVVTIGSGALSVK